MNIVRNARTRRFVPYTSMDDIHFVSFLCLSRVLLMKHCECSEEGTRNVVAECLGRLTLINPSTLLPKLREYVNSESPVVRSTVITAVKFTISDQVYYILSVLFKYIYFAALVCGSYTKTANDAVSR